MHYDTVETIGKTLARTPDDSRITNMQIENFCAAIRTTLIRQAFAGGLEGIDRVLVDLKMQRQKKRRSP